MQRYIFLSGNKIPESLYEDIVKFDNSIFQSEDTSYVCDTFIPPETTLNLLKCNTTTSVVCYDTMQKQIVGIFITLAVDDEATNKYLANEIALKDFTPNNIVDLRKVNKTNIIVYSLGVLPELRGKKVVEIDGHKTTINKAMLSTFAYNVANLISSGHSINKIISEATSESGDAMSSRITNGGLQIATDCNSVIYTNTFNFSAFKFLPNYEKIAKALDYSLDK